MLQAVPVMNQLADIALPDAPVLWPWLSGGALVFLALWILVWWRTAIRKKSSPPEMSHDRDVIEAARKRIATLTTRWRSSKIGDRDAAYELVTLMRLAWNLPQLPSHCPRWIDRSDQWNELVDTLFQLRYRRVPQHHLEERHFRWIASWLRCIPENND